MEVPRHRVGVEGAFDHQRPRAAGAQGLQQLGAPGLRACQPAFAQRGARSEEQMQLLRALWTNQSITFDGQWDQVVEAGLNPLPVQRPIPIWIGGYAEATLRRIARFGDGWFPWEQPDDAMAATLERLWGYTREAGRDPSEIGLEPRLDVKTDPARWSAFVEGWRRLGATHLCVNTMGAGFRSPAEHIGALEMAARELGIRRPG